MLESDVAWCIKYLAAKREFTHSFDTFLKQVLLLEIFFANLSLFSALFVICIRADFADHRWYHDGNHSKFANEGNAMFDADHRERSVGFADVLDFLPEVSSAAHNRMTDSNAAVREATVEMIGKFVVANYDAIPTYYPLLAERLMDTGLAVRKRVIRIMREICEKFPNFEQIPTMLAQIVRRVQDEEGVKKLVLETFQNLWFQPVSERNTPALLKKVKPFSGPRTLNIQFLNRGVLSGCRDDKSSLLKQGDKSTLAASRQIVDMFMDNVLTLENKMATENGVSANTNNTSNSEDLAGAEVHKANQERLLACLNTLTLFSKVRGHFIL
ncbi:unnamed protein product [Cylicostephanus goldi]|uniref:Uncharacterized protein n=1 Tax=Cylicostephanus goldi TaxID=71465 RepID=A0A3P6R8W4_CYLGO|nr:unnamed protein product [Cylicostephanus goldi]